ncbi:transcription factor BHLH148 isoform X2 [Setaria viridis]|uniref:BHLH domain-containing protein n=1 Tax=Setaria viridis TaxID=4556 RepID=A0A4V6D0M9_SETVI|nr:transcription factor BHLH148-like isoform X2 [Setaria viridis]TKV91435.1 hypothetical protein SEVIR_9G096400v2 [Setaria viridis]
MPGSIMFGGRRRGGDQEMGETLMRNSELETVVGAGIAGSFVFRQATRSPPLRVSPPSPSIATPAATAPATGKPSDRASGAVVIRPEMQMDSYFYAGCFHDEVPFYPHGAAPPSPELPFGLIASPGEPEPPFAPTAAALQNQNYSVSGTELLLQSMGAGATHVSGGDAHVHTQVFDDTLSGRMGGGRDQDQTMGEEGEDEPRQQRRQEPAGATVESSRGFRHMMRERQRREKLSQSYADLYAMVAARSKGDKNSIVQSAAIYIHELRGAREQLRRRNEELKARILGHDAGRQCVKVQFEVDEPASAVDSMISALRRLKGMDVRARGIRSTMSGRRLWTEMNVETTVGKRMHKQLSGLRQQLDELVKSSASS